MEDNIHRIELLKLAVKIYKIKPLPDHTSEDKVAEKIKRIAKLLDPSK